MKPDRGRAGEARAHFVALDGLRGVAAVAVACYHLPEVFGGQQWLARGALAVDFFFMLSGFVIACSYESRLRDRRLPPSQLVTVRLIRLLPMAWLGLALGGLSMLDRGALSAHGTMALALHVASGSVLLPDLWPNPYSDNILPLNWPSWSLFFELYAGTGLALVAPRLANRSLGLAVLVLALIYAASAIAADTVDLGWTARTIGPGFSRFGFAFLLGWLFWRMRVDRMMHALPVGLVALLLLAVLVVPAPPRWEVLGDLIAAMIVYPLVLASGAACRPSGTTARLSTGLGRLSYPLYAIHAPIFLLTEHHLGGLARPIAAICIALAGAWAALLLYDEPLRTWLTRRRKFVRSS